MTTDINHRLVLLTPPGAGAIGVVRLISPKAIPFLRQVFRPHRGRNLTDADGGLVRYGTFFDGDETIDDVLVSVVPQSDPTAVDICAHGGVRIIERILQTLQQLGATLTEAEANSVSIWPTANAIEREAVEALSRAKTMRAVRFLAWQREDLPAYLEGVAALCTSDPARARLEMNRLISGFCSARTLIHGVTVVLVGPPNSGKSTLFNRLVGRSAAIVSPEAGTTRDWVSQCVELEGVPIRLVDTAGRHPKATELESEAVEAAQRLADSAEVRLAVLDGAEPLPQDAAAYIPGPHQSGPNLLAVNKSELDPAWQVSLLMQSGALGPDQIVRVSAKLGDGIDGLIRQILAQLPALPAPKPDPGLFTLRQVNLVRDCLTYLETSAAATAEKIRHELIMIGS